MLGRAYDKFSGRGFPWTWKGKVPMAGFGAAGAARPAPEDRRVSYAGVLPGSCAKILRNGAVCRCSEPAQATEGGINIDKTAPAIVFGGNAGSYTVDQAVVITCNGHRWAVRYRHGGLPGGQLTGHGTGIRHPDAYRHGDRPGGQHGHGEHDVRDRAHVRQPVRTGRAIRRSQRRRRQPVRQAAGSRGGRRTGARSPLRRTS